MDFIDFKQIIICIIIHTGTIVSDDENSEFIPAAEILTILEKSFGKPFAMNKEERARLQGHGPASMYRFGDSGLVAGVISPVSNHFCGNCNRLRVTADGKLKPCLLSDLEIDLKQKLREGSSDDEIRNILLSTVALKPERHNLQGESLLNKRGMSKIGG